QRGLSSMFPDYRDQTPTTDTTPGFTNGLSSAERRVASLAALGHTNREIARDLFITVSTVEQHLTRVYRKLNVTRRSDLPGAVLGDDRQRQYPQPRHEQVASALRCAER
ncbi:DNA-binding NarL/FixJ family response regulator, partial [Streptacidiphilus sp. MAP12-16]|uniref:helix-turn-helix domain-containing protein n=1 Tax=Streptacidiphilus sp. MAP12-16 TaxID=3156300 RepID=UPI0035119BC4